MESEKSCSRIKNLRGLILKTSVKCILRTEFERIRKSRNAKRKFEMQSWSLRYSSRVPVQKFSSNGIRVDFKNVSQKDSENRIHEDFKNGIKMDPIKGLLTGIQRGFWKKKIWERNPNEPRERNHKKSSNQDNSEEVLDDMKCRKSYET